MDWTKKQRIGPLSPTLSSSGRGEGVDAAGVSGFGSGSYSQCTFWKADSITPACGWAIAYHGHVRVQPEERSRKPCGNPRLQRALEGGAFVGSAHEQEDFPGSQDVGHAEGKTKTRFGFQTSQHGMVSRGFGEPRHVSVGIQRLAGFVQGQVAVCAQPQQTKIDGSVPLQPARNSPAFGAFIRRIAPEAAETVALNAQRLEQVLSQVGVTTGSIAWRNSAPFINLQHSHFDERFRALLSQSSEPPVSFGRRPACGRTEQHIRPPLQLGKNQIGGLAAQGLAVVGYADFKQSIVAPVIGVVFRGTIIEPYPN
jgi:hypothetical protein